MHNTPEGLGGHVLTWGGTTDVRDERTSSVSPSCPSACLTDFSVPLEEEQ